MTCISRIILGFLEWKLLLFCRHHKLPFHRLPYDPVENVWDGINDTMKINWTYLYFTDRIWLTSWNIHHWIMGSTIETRKWLHHKRHVNFIIYFLYDYKIWNELRYSSFLRDLNEKRKVKNGKERDWRGL